MKISIIGTGYVGITTGVCLAASGHQVICVDKNKAIIDKINKGTAHIYEKGLEELLKEAVKNKNLTGTTDTEYAVKNSEATIISVGTPYNNGKIDLSYIAAAANEVGAALKNKEAYHVVCIKSTVIPTTTDTLVKELVEKSSGLKAGEFGLAMNPEFLREGSAVEDFMVPDRIVIGAYDDKSFAKMAELYTCFPDTPIIKVNLRTAEMIKYTSNSLLANIISFSNEIAAIAEKTGGIDTHEVFSAVALDKRLSPMVSGSRIRPAILEYLKAGCGFGGSCFPKDVSALVSYGKDLGYNPEILEAVLKLNHAQPLRLVERLKERIGTLDQKSIAVLGLAFKPETDDIRESPAISIIKRLLLENAFVHAVDPMAVENTKKALGSHKKLMYYTEFKELPQKLDAAILITPWSSFQKLTAKDFADLMKTPVLVDGRRIYDKNQMEEQGIRYIGVGLA